MGEGGGDEETRNVSCHCQVDEAKGALKPFTFNVVFEPEATQEDVLEHSGMKR